MANKKLSTSYRKLKHKYEYLTLELKEMEEEFGARAQEFEKDFEEFYKLLTDEQRQAIDDAQKKRNEELAAKRCESKNEPEPKTQRQELKKIYKEIAKQIHPDKFALRSKEVQEEKKALFQKAYEHYEDENLVALERIAIDLGIQIDPPSEGHIGIVEEQIAKTSSQLKGIASRIGWGYGELKDESAKASMMKRYFEAILRGEI